MVKPDFWFTRLKRQQKQLKIFSLLIENIAEIGLCRILVWKKWSMVILIPINKFLKHKKSPANCETLNFKWYDILNYVSLTFTAFNPFFPSSRSKVTSSFSLILSFKPLECTKYSLVDSESLIKPNPLDSLKNFTVPFFIFL